MQIPILNGIYTDVGSDYRTSYPINLIPVPKQNGISNGYLRPAWGLIQNGTGPGKGRGGIDWNGTLYRVMGNDLVSIDRNGKVSTYGVTEINIFSNSPRGIHSDGTYCFVANYDDGTVSKIEVATSTVLATIAVGLNPIGVYSDGTYCWAVNNGGDSVSKIEIASNSVAATITVGIDPIGVFSDGTTAWVTNFTDNTISVIDIATDAVTGTINVGTGPWGIHSDGTYLWVANNGSDNVTRIVIATSATSTISVGDGPRWISSDGVHVWVSNYNSNTISKISIANSTELKKITVGTNPTGIYSDGSFIYVAVESLDIAYKINTVTEAFIATIKVGDSPNGLSFDSSYIFISNKGDDTVSQIDVSLISQITGTDLVTFDYSADYLSISADNKLWLYNGTTLTQNTDADLLDVLDHIWIDGYFMTTDGEFIVVTDIDDPFSVTPTNYAASEADSDPIVALLKIRNEAYALNRYTVEVFDNVGGTGFPFARIETAQIEKGVIGTQACCVFIERLAFLGSGRNEAPAIYIGFNGTAEKISTREIDIILKDYTEAQLSTVLLEAVADENHQLLFVHLPDQTLVFDGIASADVGQKIWFFLRSSLDGKGQYLARAFIWIYDKWHIEDPTSTKIGYITDDSADHYSANVKWEFATTIIYNQARGFIVNMLELIGLTGRNVLGNESTIWTEYSHDGITWSQKKSAKIGTIGNRTKRPIWLKQGLSRRMRMQRFSGTSDANLTISAIEAEIEGCNA